MNYALNIFFLLLRIFSNPTANVFQKKLSSNLAPSAINFYTYLILSISCIPFYNTYLLNRNIYSAEFVILILTAGLLCALGNVFMIKAINLGELSVLGPINSYKSVIGLISGFIILKEIPNIFGFLGILMIIFGSRYLFEKEESLSLALLKRKDIHYRIIALILTGIEASLLKKIILMSSVEVCVIFWCLTGLFWSFIILKFFNKNSAVKNSKECLYILLTAGCIGIMQYSTNYVFSKMQVGPALALFQLSSIVSVLFGYKIFKEKDLLRKLTGCIIMITGSCIIILL